MRNLSVLARNEEDGFFYRGSVRCSVFSREDKMVEFADSALPDKNVPWQQIVPWKQIIPYGGAIPWNYLKVYDCVLTSVRDCRQREFFVPGLVVGLPTHCHMGPKFYTILIYTNKHVCRERIDIVWIGSEKYKEILDYLWTKSKLPNRPSSSHRILTNRRPKSPVRLGIRNVVNIRQRMRRPPERPPVKRPPVKQSRRVKVDMRIGRTCPRGSNPLVTMPQVRQSNGSMGTRSGRSIVSRINKPVNVSPVIRSKASMDTRSGRSTATRTSAPHNFSPVRQSEGSFGTLSRRSTASRTSIKDTFSLVRQSEGSLDTRSDRSSASRTSYSDTFESLDSMSQESPSPARSKARTSISSLSHTESHRKTSPSRISKLEVGTEVLARFPDDGWYYFGVIQGTRDGRTYDVLDSTGHTEEIVASDIIDADDCGTGSKQPGDHVLALHPEYVFSYAPAEILSVDRSDGASLRFFDGAKRKLPSHEIYKISAGTYRRVTSYIESCIIGQGDKMLVIRDDSTGVYKKMNVTVVGQSRCNSCIIIEDDITARKVPIIDIFQPDRTVNHRKPEDWKHVLAPADDNTYLPATMVSTNPLKVQTCINSEIRQLTSLDDCFFLSEMYYKNAVNYINHRNN